MLPVESYQIRFWGRFRSLLCSCQVFPALAAAFVCWFYWNASGFKTLAGIFSFGYFKSSWPREGQDIIGRRYNKNRQIRILFELFWFYVKFRKRDSWLTTNACAKPPPFGVWHQTARARGSCVYRIFECIEEQTNKQQQRQKSEVLNSTKIQRSIYSGKCLGFILLVNRSVLPNEENTFWGH